jgi:hypothetical protein
MSAQCIVGMHRPFSHMNISACKAKKWRFNKTPRPYQWRCKNDNWGVGHIHIFEWIWKEINNPEHEYMNMGPPIIVLATALVRIAKTYEVEQYGWPKSCMGFQIEEVSI